MYAMGCSTMFQPSRKESNVTHTRPLVFMGRRIFVSRRNSPQPSSLAASIMSSLTDLKLWVNIKVPRGMKMDGSISAE